MTLKLHGSSSTHNLNFPVTNAIEKINYSQLAMIYLFCKQKSLKWSEQCCSFLDFLKSFCQATVCLIRVKLFNESKTAECTFNITNLTETLIVFAG